MAFGQQSGPPASTKQVRYLLALLQEAGHADFRDARGPMRFNQRQAGGRFTREEASAFIEQLAEGGDPDAPVETPASGGSPGVDRGPQSSSGPRGRDQVVVRSKSSEMPPPADGGAGVRAGRAEGPLSRASAADLAAELRRRGWTVTEPGAAGPSPESRR